MEHFLTITRPDGLKFTAPWRGVPGRWMGRISGELVIAAAWGEDRQWRKAVQLYIDRCGLELKAKAAITQFEREIRAGSLDG